MCEAILRQDDGGNGGGALALNADKLDALRDLIPTAPELRKLEGFRGDPQKDLGTAEQFVYAVARFQPRFDKRLAAFAFKLQFPQLLASIHGQCRVVARASEELRGSAGLALVLRQMLVIGNIMNEGTHKGQASGITLDSLLKLTHTKGADKKTTVLDYAVTLCLDRVRRCSLLF